MPDQYKHFYTKYKDKLFSYLFSRSNDYDVARDIMQESFTRHYQHYGHNPVISPALLFTIARNALTDHFRYYDRFRVSDEIDVQSKADEERSFIVRETTAQLTAALDRLHDIDREILALAVTGVSYKDIASTLDLTEANIKVRVHRARVKLREIMKKEEK